MQKKQLKKIGIPRGLFYYQYKDFLEIFFSELGYEVVVSSKTNKGILKKGVFWLSLKW